MGVAKASPATIWNTCFAPMKWESWDEDVVRLKDVSGPCKDGTKFLFVMKDGYEATTVLSNVKQDQRLTFSGSMMGGWTRFKGIIELIPDPDGQKQTKVDYTFEMSGMLGRIVNFVAKSKVVQGTEHGLQNIIRLSEAAERACASSSS